MPWVFFHGDIQIQFCNICRNHTSFSIPFEFDWINFTQLINIWYKKNLQGNWTICIIQGPVTPIYDVKISHMRGQIKPKVRSKSNYPNLSFWYEIRHLGGQIKHKGADQCARQDICMKSIVPASVQSSVWQRHSWHGLLPVVQYFNKGNHDVVVSNLITLRLQIRTSSWTFSPASIFKGVLHNLLIPSSTSVWNQWSPLIQWHSFMNTCTECSVSL